MDSPVESAGDPRLLLRRSPSPPAMTSPPPGAGPLLHRSLPRPAQAVAPFRGAACMPITTGEAAFNRLGAAPEMPQRRREPGWQVCQAIARNRTFTSRPFTSLHPDKRNPASGFSPMDDVCVEPLCPKHRESPTRPPDQEKCCVSYSANPDESKALLLPDRAAVARSANGRPACVPTTLFSGAGTTIAGWKRPGSATGTSSGGSKTRCSCPG